MALHFNSNGIVAGNGGNVSADCCCDNLGGSFASFFVAFEGCTGVACGVATCSDLDGGKIYISYNSISDSWVGFGFGFALEIIEVGSNWVMTGYEGTLIGQACFQYTQPVNGGTRPTSEPWNYVSGCSCLSVQMGPWKAPEPVSGGGTKCTAGIDCCDTVNLTIADMTIHAGYCGGCLCNTFNGDYVLKKDGRIWSGLNQFGELALLQCLDNIWYLTIQCGVGLDCATYSSANVDDCVPSGDVWDIVSGNCTYSNIVPSPITITIVDDISCTPPPVNPCAPDPEMLVTVFDVDYAGGNISWCGEVWTQAQVQAGDTRSVCPTTYLKEVTPTPSVLVHNSWTQAGLTLRRRQFGLGPNTAGNYYFTSAGWANEVRFNVGTVNVYGDRYFFPPQTYIPRPATYSFGTAVGGDTQLTPLVATVGPPRPSPHGTYAIQDVMFGSYVTGGVAYTWAKGAGW